MAEKKRIGRPPKHGAYSKTALVPLTDESTKAIQKIMSGEHMPLAPQDKFLIAMLGRTLAQLELIDRWLSENGLFADEEKGQPQPVLATYWTAMKVASNICNSLGLSPTARVRLGIGMAHVEDLVSRIKGVPEMP